MPTQQQKGENNNELHEYEANEHGKKRANTTNKNTTTIINMQPKKQHLCNAYISLHFKNIYVETKYKSQNIALSTNRQRNFDTNLIQPTTNATIQQTKQCSKTNTTNLQVPPISIKSTDSTNKYVIQEKCNCRTRKYDFQCSEEYLQIMCVPNKSPLQAQKLHSEMVHLESPGLRYKSLLSLTR